VNSSENVIKWSGFYKNDDEAQEVLNQKAFIISQKKLIVSSKKELTQKKAQNLLLYKFTIITTEK